MPLYELTSPEPPWGDYGDILTNGMAGHLPRQGGLLQLARTGPFVPPVTFPTVGAPVVTDALWRTLRAALPTLAVRPVVKRHIVDIPWHTWDRQRAEPAFYPRGGEPEGYLLAAPHDVALAEAIGELWELTVPVATSVTLDRGQLVGERWPSEPIFHVPGGLSLYITEPLAELLRAHAGEWAALVELGASS